MPPRCIGQWGSSADLTTPISPRRTALYHHNRGSNIPGVAGSVAEIRQVLATPYATGGGQSSRRGHGAMCVAIAADAAKPLGRDPAGVSPGSRSTAPASRRGHGAKWPGRDPAGEAPIAAHAAFQLTSSD
jgi:hypothetical protein